VLLLSALVLLVWVRLVWLVSPHRHQKAVLAVQSPFVLGPPAKVSPVAAMLRSWQGLPLLKRLEALLPSSAETQRRVAQFTSMVVLDLSLGVLLPLLPGKVPTVPVACLRRLVLRLARRTAAALL
jgi:hypothetical protein